MLTQSQIKKLSYLNKKIQSCHKCKNLWRNGKAFPYFTKFSQLLAIAEGPGKEEVQEDYQTPLIGKAGRLLFRELGRKEINLKRKDFMILNTVQCRPVIDGKNGKPSLEEIENCKFWTSKYIEIFSPEIIIAFGNYALNYFFEDNLGITKESGFVRHLDNGTKVIPCLHPASLLYSSDNLSLFRHSLKVFKEETIKAHILNSV